VKDKLLQKAYNADLIIRRLSNLHPNFYPIPGNINNVPTQNHVYITLTESGFLTKQELLNLYGICGNYLHRGSIRQLLSNKKPRLEFDKIWEWNQKIGLLFSPTHHIKLSDPSKILIVVMNNVHDGGKVQCALAETKEPVSEN
jgi:hypothetical protein